MTRVIAPHNDYRAVLQKTQERPPSATVVVPVFERTELLARTLSGFAAQTVQTPVIVVDDGSAEDVAAVLRQLDSLDVTLLRQEHAGYGAGRARNLGTAHAESDVVLFVDADCIPAEDLVERHLLRHVADNVAVIGSRRHVRAAGLSKQSLADGTADLEGAVVDDGAGDFRRVLTRRTSSLTTGTEAYRAFVSSNVSINRDTFLSVGGFSEDFTRWGGEDTELGWRLQQAGVFFVPADDAVVYHQIDLDGPEGWRAVQRHDNQGLIASKIPHRFYRRPGGLLRNETPKVSFVVWPCPASGIETLVSELLSSNLRDIEIVLVADPDEHEPFAGATRADQRVRFADPGKDPIAGGIRESTGEIVLTIHGALAPDRRMAARVAKKMDDRPRISSVTVGYRVFTPVDGNPLGGWADHLRADDPEVVDAAWDRGVPLAAAARRRDWARVLGAGLTSSDGWRAIRSWNIADHLAQPLVWVPGASPSDRPERFRVLNQDRDDVKALLRKRKPIAAARRGMDVVRRRPPPRPVRMREPRSESDVFHLRYVGWTGRDNLGDEAMLRAVRESMPWAEIATSGDPRDGLVLGGGTLINRTTYLRWLQERDSPRVERVVFGTGVASPEFWGLTEDTGAWVDYLDSCGFVGVRGPRSIETLRSWGYEGELDLMGDPALALRLDVTPDTVPGRVVVAPAWTNGELWGGSDAAVFDTLTSAVRHWLSEGRDVVLFSCHPDDDRPCVEIMRGAGRPDLTHHFGYLDIDDAMRTLAAAEVVVAERLHAAVLAAAVGRPFVSLEYRPKLADFADSVGAGRWNLRTDAVSSGALLEAVSTADEQSPSVAQRVDDHRGRLAAAAERVQEAVRA